MKKLVFILCLALCAPAIAAETAETKEQLIEKASTGDDHHKVEHDETAAVERTEAPAKKPARKMGGPALFGEISYTGNNLSVTNGFADSVGISPKDSILDTVGILADIGGGHDVLETGIQYRQVNFEITHSVPIYSIIGEIFFGSGQGSAVDVSNTVKLKYVTLPLAWKHYFRFSDAGSPCYFKLGAATSFLASKSESNPETGNILKTKNGTPIASNIQSTDVAGAAAIGLKHPLSENLSGVGELSMLYGLTNTISGDDARLISYSITAGLAWNL
jgi:hypothetical protein